MTACARCRLPWEPSPYFTGFVLRFAVSCFLVCMALVPMFVGFNEVIKVGRIHENATVTTDGGEFSLGDQVTDRHRRAPQTCGDVGYAEQTVRRFVSNGISVV